MMMIEKSVCATIMVVAKTRGFCKPVAKPLARTIPVGELFSLQ